jgi:hypothetical protein
MIKPKAVSVFLGLLLASLMRLVWRWLMSLPIIDPLGLTAICVSLIVLIYLMIARPRTGD